jgi:hypothetical protein
MSHMRTEIHKSRAERLAKLVDRYREVAIESYGLNNWWGIDADQQKFALERVDKQWTELLKTMAAMVILDQVDELSELIVDSIKKDNKYEANREIVRRILVKFTQPS